MQVMFNNIYRPVFQGYKPLKNHINSDSEFLSLPKKDIFEKIKTSLTNNQNRMGRGGDAEVWKIEDSDYCIRIPHDSFGKIFSGFSRHLTREDRANHTVLKLGQKATIMPIIKGYTFGDNDTENKKVAKMIEEMPVEAFTELFKQIKTAEHNSNLSFDIGMQNIIINPKTKTMTAIDFFKSPEHLFKNEIFCGIFESLCRSNLSSLEQMRNCAGKLMLAALSIQKTNPEMKPFESGFYEFITKLKNNNIVENPTYIQILLKNIEKLEQGKDKTKAEKVIVTLVKQLFGVSSEPVDL